MFYNYFLFYTLFGNAWHPTWHVLSRNKLIRHLVWPHPQILQSDWSRACHVIFSCNLIGYRPEERRTLLVCFHYSSFLSSHPTVRICNWLRNNPLWSVHLLQIKRRHSRVFCHKTTFRRIWSSFTFFANFLSLNVELCTLKRFSGSLCDRFEQAGAEHDGIFTRNCTRNQSIKALQASR